MLSRSVPTCEIAQTLRISHATVRTHSQNILGKRTTALPHTVAVEKYRRCRIAPQAPAPYIPYQK
ncbi:MAG: response regulator transcription factor [Nitrospinae bacterium]|nr:response regulator transcription factor [Nitrospinota bacterium]